MICVHFLCQVPLLVLLSIHSIHRGIQDVHSDQHVDKGDQLQNWRLLHVFHSTHSVHRCMGIQHIHDVHTDLYRSEQDLNLPLPQAQQEPRLPDKQREESSSS